MQETETGDQDDVQLVIAARRGDRAALEQLLTEHHPRILAICRQVLSNSADAEDAAQSTLISITRSLSLFDSKSSFKTWVYRIAVNASTDELRKRQRHHQKEELAKVAVVDRTSNQNSHDHAEQIGLRSQLKQALDRLPEEFRVAVILRDLHGLEYTEIATATGSPVGTVRSRIARGRAQLADAIKEFDANGEPSTPDSTSKGS